MQSLSTFGTVFTLLAGALGALLAILLKEAVQQAILKRTVAWQLFGYILLWQKQVLRYPPLFAMYQKVKDRELELRTSLTQGTSAFAAKHQQQSAQRDELRKAIREAVIKAASDAKPALDALTPLNGVWDHVRTQLAQQRKDLLDAKTFISDRDAAVLGRSFAFNVVQFKASLQSILAIAETFPSTLVMSEGDRANLFAELIDQLVLQGEAFFESLHRLEQGVDRLSKLSLWRLVWTTLKD